MKDRGERLPNGEISPAVCDGDISFSRPQKAWKPNERADVNAVALPVDMPWALSRLPKHLPPVVCKPLSV